jgi:hypothetical protein
VTSLRQRVDKMTIEMNANPPNMKALQSLLTGSLLAQVNSGPTDIFETFLEKNNAAKYPPDEVLPGREIRTLDFFFFLENY